MKRGLSRVASLPSVRTPPEEKPQGVFQMPRAQQQQSRDVPMQTPGGARGSRTEDDLKRYEQAILARQHEVPLKLSIQPKARRGRGSHAGSVSPNVNAQQQQQQQQQMQGMVPQAYDGNGLQGMFMEPGPMENPALPQRAARRRRDEQRRGAVAGAGDGAHVPEPQPHSRSPASYCGPCGREEAGRPSFKRLPSQTLENAVQKRAAVRWGGGEEAVDSATDSEEVEGAGARAGRAIVGLRNGNGSGMPPPPPPPQAFNAENLGLMERYRRQSAPTGVRPAVNGTATTTTKQEATAAQ